MVEAREADALEQPRGGGSHDARDARLSGGIPAALQVVRGVGAGWRGGWPFVAAAVTSPRFRIIAMLEAGRAAEAPQGRIGAIRASGVAPGL